MAKVNKIIKMTDNKFLNLYHLQAENRVGKDVNYFVASRSENAAQMDLVTHENHPDGVAIYSLYGEDHDHVVLVRQYRYPIDDYIYEFPAGLVEKGEDYRGAAVRELKEETGLDLTLLSPDPSYERPFYTTIGMTDESCSIVFGYASGTVSKAGLEESEELDVVLVDREEAKRILREERVALLCAYMLMFFIAEEEPFGFLK